MVAIVVAFDVEIVVEGTTVVETIVGAVVVVAGTIDFVGASVEDGLTVVETAVDEVDGTGDGEPFADVVVGKTCWAAVDVTMVGVFVTVGAREVGVPVGTSEGVSVMVGRGVGVGGAGVVGT